MITTICEWISPAYSVIILERAYDMIKGWWLLLHYMYSSCNLHIGYDISTHLMLGGGWNEQAILNMREIQAQV